ncbi:unnamed protein product [Linum trigynum]|uniref:Uncharacterized protein n=1 Tax=Linum trigynum TaxID=586398 RepID=A0AAV2ER40_9ROSI
MTSKASAVPSIFVTDQTPLKRRSNSDQNQTPRAHRGRSKAISNSVAKRIEHSTKIRRNWNCTNFRGGGLQSIPKGKGEVPSCLCFGGLRLCIITSPLHTASSQLHQANFKKSRMIVEITLFSTRSN